MADRPLPPWPPQAGPMGMRRFRGDVWQVPQAIAMRVSAETRVMPAAATVGVLLIPEPHRTARPTPPG